MLVGVLAGLYISKSGWFLNSSWLVMIIPLALFLIKPKLATLFAVILIGFIIGSWRGGAFYQQVNGYSNYFGEQVTVVGNVVDDTSYDERRQTEFHIGNVIIDGEELPGRVRVRGFGANQVTRGDLVKVNGNLNRTLGTSRQGSVTFANIEVIGKNTSFVEKVRGKFFAGVYSSLPEPQASLGLGFLVGVRTALPEKFSEQLALVGLTHIIAVSGYNLTILVQVVRRGFSKRSAYQSVLFSGILIALFLLMTGWSPSIMRAAIVTGFSLVAWYYGRTFLPLILILLGAGITGYINPLYIWGDAGWYLSFLAFAGVLILAPLFISRVYKKKKPNFLMFLLIETLAAIVMTAPYVAWLFGKVSLIAPVANVIVGPLIPITMLLVFLVGVIGIFFPILALWVAIFPRAILTFNVWVVEKLSAIPNAQLTVTVTPAYMAVMYAFLFSLIIVLWRVQKREIEKGQAKKIDWSLV
jgi:competence protein ComEC